MSCDVPWGCRKQIARRPDASGLTREIALAGTQMRSYFAVGFPATAIWHPT